MSVTEWIATLPTTSDGTGNVLEYVADGVTFAIAPSALAALLTPLTAMPPTAVSLTALDLPGFAPVISAWHTAGLIS